jgi:hypothetical protein
MKSIYKLALASLVIAVMTFAPSAAHASKPGSAHAHARAFHDHSPRVHDHGSHSHKS